MNGVKLVHRAMPLKLERLQWFLVIGKHVSFLPNIGWKCLYGADCSCNSLLVQKILFGSGTHLLLSWQSSIPEAASQPDTDVSTKAVFVIMKF